MGVAFFMGKSHGHRYLYWQKMEQNPQIFFYQIGRFQSISNS